jgi:uncharacterized protein YbjT (DUF2867 family)
MKILITGTTGYIAKRLIPLLLKKGHTLICCVRDLKRIPESLKIHPNIEFIKIDFLSVEDITIEHYKIDAAYYLIHSMSTNSDDFDKLESLCAMNFKKLVEKTSCRQVIYLSGIVNDVNLSKHLTSRYQVEKILDSNIYSLTVLRAGIIVGSGSASFEIIRDLVEKLPVMITPKWLNTKSQPIAIRDVLTYLTEVLLEKKLFNTSCDIYGPEILTYKEMLLQFSEVRNLKRYIITVPVLTPRLSSYWLYFVTSTSFKLAYSLVNSMKVEVIGRPSMINEIININPISYTNAVKNAFISIEQNSVLSSWKDAISSGVFNKELSPYINIPKYGCFRDIRSKKIVNEANTINRIWSIGGENGWFKFNYLWKFRGFIDKVFGGVGLRRGRRHPSELSVGDSLDFWRVIYTDKEEKRLLLLAEMKLPGEAWLEFKIVKDTLYQRAVFRPKGVSGRLYWLAVLPFHSFVFKGMINELTKK